jgi:signal transduction histidine kinase
LKVDDDGGGYELGIEDNGIGFDQSRVGKLGHQGLANTRGRVAELGGTVTIDTAPGSGTRVIVHVPRRTA